MNGEAQADDLVERLREQQISDMGTAMASGLWDRAVNEIRRVLDERTAMQIRRLIETRDPKWPGTYHFGWGRQIRNDLRVAGYGEKELGVRNLDNVYVAMVEEAVLVQGTPDIERALHKLKEQHHQAAVSLERVAVKLGAGGLVVAAVVFVWWWFF